MNTKDNYLVVFTKTATYELAKIYDINHELVLKDHRPF